MALRIALVCGLAWLVGPVPPPHAAGPRAWLSGPGQARAQAVGIDPENRPVEAVRIEGLRDTPETLVRNALRLTPGEPYAQRTVDEDLVRLTYLNRFSRVNARVQATSEGAVIVTYVVDEQQTLDDVWTTGNFAISDQELKQLVGLRPGDPADPGMIRNGLDAIRRAYREKGFFLNDVTVDRNALENDNILIYQVREGPLVRVQSIDFEGNDSFSDRMLRSEVQSKTQILFFPTGALSRETLTTDVARLREFYRDRGFLEAEVGRRVVMSPDRRQARITFIVAEGRRYRVGDVRVEGATVFTDREILETLALKVGDVFATDKLRAGGAALQNRYGNLGFIEAQVSIDRLFRETDPIVDVLVRIVEGRPYLVGTVSVVGNASTKDNVVMRELRGLNPNRRFDGQGLRVSERRLQESPLFASARITVSGEATDPQRDVVVEVREGETGSLSLGAGISSDAGLIGAIDLTQRNFDISRPPQSMGEMFSGRAFRGAGQTFNIAIQPGADFSRYSISLGEPHLFDSDFFASGSAFFWARDRFIYEEQRFGGSFTLGRRLGDVWSVDSSLRAEAIKIDQIDANLAPRQVFDVEGDSVLTSISAGVTRNTTDSRLFPTRGSVSEVNFSFAGVLGGDYEFTRMQSSFRKFWTVDEDFLGRRSVLSLRTEVGYIFQFREAPIFEKLYAGGHRSFRGFAFRGAGPHSRNEPVGGDWLFLLGLEYNIPVWEETLRWVFFTDTGTVDDPVDFGKYRVSVGTGVRIQLPFLGQAPFALDFAVPLIKEDEDRTRLVSFDLAIPF